MPQRAQTDAEIEACFDVMAELRPHLKKSQFLSTVRNMESEGFRLMYIATDNKVVAAAGYRICSNLFMGKHLYVDDLVTANANRSSGYGKRMIEWLRDEAERSSCKFLHLDSGTHRGRAHKFYFQEGFTIASYHFSQEL
ncbi:GNAT family N-acetyltransferase [SAR92 clade bacterium H455]|uniref:GNAT family N-acetyltransferase n=1 Tax=SAR92 clade bacterium H455 TaxID=2974818 RepID=A0ABY5TN28_9GAMM|nr:GNAT family N-acetyltransferase [SAR92 clade bacterium H455]